MSHTVSSHGAGGAYRAPGTSRSVPVWQRHDIGWRLTTIGPLVAFLLVFTLAPILYLGVVSFHNIEWTGGRAIWTFVGLANYADVADAPFFIASIRNTLVFAVASVTIEMILGFGLALLVSGLAKTRAVFITIFLIPLLVPPIVIGAMWRLLYSFDFGLINFGLLWLGLNPVNWLGDADVALTSIIILDVWHWTPFTFLLLLAGLEGLPQDLYEAARIDGASSWQLTRYITIPLMMPIILVTLVTRALLALKVFDEVFLLTGGGPGTSTEVISLSIFRTFFLEDRRGDGAALAIMAIILVFFAAFVGWLGVRNRGPKKSAPA